jgi:integrase
MLTDTLIRAAKPREKAYKLADARGLYLLVNPNGSRWWRWKYYFEGREKLLSFGVYPDITLKDARDRCDETRRLVAKKIDPSALRKAEKFALANTFAALALEWLEKRKMEKAAAKTMVKYNWMLESFVLPQIGRRPIANIAAADLLSMLRRIEARGKYETCGRVKHLCGQIFLHAIPTGRALRDPTQDLRGALITPKTRHHAAITDPARIGELMRAIDGYQGHVATQFALKLAPLLFVRPGELRGAEWSEINLELAEWRIPAGRTKMKKVEHVVPLSRQAIKLLTELQTWSGQSNYLFPSPRSNKRPISENSVTAALRRMGYSGDQMTWHGFRTLASTRLNEAGFAPDVIELQLAHKDQNEVRDAYNRASRLTDRMEMMQSWADYLDRLRAGKVAEFRKRKAA